MSIGIYMYKNKINNKIYVGKSQDLNERKINHKSRAFNYYPSNSEYNSLLHKAFREFGYEQFEYSILEECSLGSLNEKEIYWIQKLNSIEPNGYNRTSGGEDGGVGILKFITKEQYEKVIYLLKNTSKTHQEIYLETGVSISYISYIRNGKSMKKEGENYPLRPFNKEKDLNGNIIEEEKNQCINCGKIIHKTSIRCPECNFLKNRKTERPESLELAQEILKNGFEGTGRKYGVSGNAIKKWCHSYNMGKLKQEIAIWYQKQIGSN